MAGEHENPRDTFVTVASDGTDPKEAVGEGASRADRDTRIEVPCTLQCSSATVHTIPARNFVHKLRAVSYVHVLLTDLTSPIPVLLNDVFFATHALIVCIVTAGQCFIFKRGKQRVSYTCMAVIAIMGIGVFVSGLAIASDYFNLLQFVTSLSFIKMAVTLLKYIPQAILNFRRTSTTGWSIGNIPLNFTGGSLDIVQMGLCWNVPDWTAFYGNPVKFGLGLVSMLFDILFMIQHYILYPHRKDKDRNGEGEDEITDESDKEKRHGSKSEKSKKSNEMNGEKQRDDSRKVLDEGGHGHQKGLGTQEKEELMPTNETKPVQQHATFDLHFKYNF